MIETDDTVLLQKVSWKHTHPKIRTLRVYDFIGMCVVFSEEILLNIYKQAQELGTVDEFFKNDSKLFFQLQYILAVAFFIIVWGSTFRFLILFEGDRMMGFKFTDHSNFCCIPKYVHSAPE